MDPPILDPNQQLSAVELIDEWGRRWVGESFERASPKADSSDDEDAVGVEVTWQPYTWHHWDCDDDNFNDEHHWDLESRDLVNAIDYTDRQKATIKVDIGFSGECSGVMVRPQWALTANHCLYDEDGDRISNGDIEVVLEWAGQDRDVNGSSAPLFDPDDFEPSEDWALLHLESAFSASFADMDVSDASNTTLDGVGANFHNFGFPYTIDGCEGTGLLTISDNNDITAHTTDTIRWNGDSGARGSGGPLFFCPTDADDWCGSGEFGDVVTVVSGFDYTNGRLTGPRMRYWFDLTQDAMDNWPP